MKTELQNKAWSVLPKEFKEEVKKLYVETEVELSKKKGSTDNLTQQLRGMNRQLAYLFGHDNLTSDAEGEEMLMVPKREVRSIYDNAIELIAMTSMDEDSNRMAMLTKALLEELFGSKCLPDKVVVAENATTSKSKPAEPEEKSRNLSQETANCDKHFDNILKDSFRNERRLNIAAMAMQGILSNEVSQDVANMDSESYQYPESIAKYAVACADALIAELNKTKKEL